MSHALVFVFALAVPPVLAGCAFVDDHVRSFRGGEPRAELERRLGRPDGYQRDGSTDSPV
jgi:hypothetical protein